MGKKLGRKTDRVIGKANIDVVVPIPDTSRTSAMSLAHVLGVRFTEGFIKNRYIGRTFIMPGQAVRKKSVRQKLNPIDVEFRGKKVLLVDDESAITANLAPFLERAGFVVEVAADGQQAVGVGLLRVGEHGSGEESVDGHEATLTPGPGGRQRLRRGPAWQAAQLRQPAGGGAGSR